MQVFIKVCNERTKRSRCETAPRGLEEIETVIVIPMVLPPPGANLSNCTSADKHLQKKEIKL